MTQPAKASDLPDLPDLPDRRDQPRDRFGNVILSERSAASPASPASPLGQYRIRSRRDGRVLRVCGEAAASKHLVWWDYDAGERRMVCRLCWPDKR